MCFRLNYLFVLVEASVLGTVVSQHHVCLKAYDLGDNIQMNCTVDLLNYHITFKNPTGEDYGRCEPPILKQCDSPNLSQVKDTTTLLINKSVDIYGTWTCYHGTNFGFDSVSIHKPKTPTGRTLSTMWKETGIAFIVVFVILFLVNMVVATNSFVKWMRGRLEQRKEQPELQPLIEKKEDEVMGICKACTLASVCAICSDCEIMFCEICCNTHKRSKPEHKVCQIDHVVTSNFHIDCKECKKQTAVHVCMQCVREMCISCCKYHTKINHTHRIKTLVLTKGQGRERKRNETQRLPEIQPQYTITTGDDQNSPPPRICGVCFIADGRIVIAEYHCKQIRIYKRDVLDFMYDLKQEPKGMTTLNNNIIAIITYPYERQIKLYEINSSSVNEIDIFRLADKPFSIAYNQHHFAVELGEGEDGVIVILDSKGKTIYKINNANAFAYFTSNTMRLALDMSNRKVFVAALSKKAVSCVDFEGNVLWRQAVPSPRGIVFVDNILSEKNMIIASKRWNLIFSMRSDNGKNDIIMSSGSIEGPRYVDYNMAKKLFCIQVDNGNVLVYKFDITEMASGI